MRSIKLVVLCVLALVLVFPLAGCQKVAEKAAQKAVESATGVKVDQNGDKVTIEGDNGESVEIQGGSSSKLPDNLPSDFPVYDATLISASSVTGSEGTSFFLSFETDKPVSDVHDWYKTQLPDKGWTVENDMTNTADGQDSALVSAKKGDLGCQVTVIGESGKTTIETVVNQP